MADISCSWSTLGQPDTRGVYVGSLTGGEPTRLLASDAAAVYAPPGYLLLVSQGVLSARPFDPVHLAITGEPIPIAPAVAAPGVGRTAHSRFRMQACWRIAAAGQVVASSSGSTEVERGWMSSRHPTTRDSPVQSSYHDGSRVAVTRFVQGNVDAWLLDVTRAATTRLTSDASADGNPVWSPDGTQIVFYSLT